MSDEDKTRTTSRAGRCGRDCRDNRNPDKCHLCGKHLDAGDGHLDGKKADGRWNIACHDGECQQTIVSKDVLASILPMPTLDPESAARLDEMRARMGIPTNSQTA